MLNDGPTLVPVSSQRYEELTLFPLVTPGEVELPYLLLADALARETVTIGEVGIGSVPELVANNRSDEDVLVLDGEQLIGAKQNRMPNRTILLPGKSETRIPVSCMEQGRWRYRTEKFEHGTHYSPSGVRRKARDLEAQLAEQGVEAAPGTLARAQGAVWEEIHAYHEALGTHSPTDSLDEAFEQRRADLEAGLEAFPLVDGQIGLIAFLGERALGMDVIGGRGLYSRLHQRLLRGYLMDALEARAVAESGGAAGGQAPPRGRADRAHDSTASDEGAALRFLHAAQAARRAESPTAGKGTYRVLSGEVIGAELLEGDRLVHRSAFPRAEDGRRGLNGSGESTDPIAGPSVRGRWWG